MRLFGGRIRLELLVDLNELGLARAQRALLRIFTTYIDKLEVVIQTVCHI